MNAALVALLEKLDASPDALEEHTVASQINSLFPKGSDLSDEELGECMAFRFVPEYPGECWGTYYGPEMIFPDGKGQNVESPSIKRVTKTILAHWERRSTEARHPLLKGRYADLVWDFSKTAINERPSHTAALTVIDSNLSAAAMGGREPLDGYRFLERALALACSLKNEPEKLRCKEALIKFEHDVGVDQFPGLWGQSFDLLIDGSVDVTREERHGIVEDLSRRFERLSAAEDGSPWNVEAAGLRLARHYHKLGDEEKVTDYLKGIENSYRRLAKKGDPLQVAAWFQTVHDYYMQFGRKDDAARMHSEIFALGNAVQGSMKTVTIESRISMDDVDTAV